MPHDPQRTRQSIVALQALREQAERGRDQALMQLEQARRAPSRCSRLTTLFITREIERSMSMAG